MSEIYALVKNIGNNMDQFRGGIYNNFVLTKYRYMGRLSFRVAALTLAAIALASCGHYSDLRTRGLGTGQSRCYLHRRH